MKIVNCSKHLELQPLNVTYIVISTAITAYSRIHISQVKMKVIAIGGNLYYSDTDSIVTDICLSDSIISNNELGKLKLEYMVKQGIFISGKIYWLMDSNDKAHNKAKGIKSNSLSYTDYLNLLNGIDVTTSVKTESKTDWSKGEVVMKDKENIVIHSKIYVKCTKIYDINGKLIDTKPLIIYDIDKSIVLYTRKDLIVYNNQIIYTKKVKDFTIYKSYYDIYKLFYLYLSLGIIIPVSLVAYVLTIVDDDVLYNTNEDSYILYDSTINQLLFVKVESDPDPNPEIEVVISN